MARLTEFHRQQFINLQKHFLWIKRKFDAFKLYSVWTNGVNCFREYMRIRNVSKSKAIHVFHELFLKFPLQSKSFIL
jgi:hypothetical protein